MGSNAGSLLSDRQAQPKVAIIIVNWNGWQDTLLCLASLRRLTYPNFRVLVVDNGSTNDSVSRIREACPDVEIIETGRNLGWAGGTNVGIQRAMAEGADYVWLLNNDTVVDPQALTRLVGRAERDPHLGAVGSVLYYMAEPEKVQAWAGGSVNLWTGLCRHFTRPVPEHLIHYLTGASMLLRTQALREVGLLDEHFFMYWEDADLSFRLRKGGWKLAVEPGAKIWHKEGASVGRGTAAQDAYFVVSALRFFSLHAPIPVVPAVVSVALKLVRRLLKRDWDRMRAVWRAAVRPASVGSSCSNPWAHD
jgi:GT2 family glycosyltransferase